MAQSSNSYDANQIQVLEGLDPVRKRPGMYIGSTDTRGLHHLVYEVVDNCIDEAMAGYCDKVDVVIQADGGIRVKDNGGASPRGFRKRPGNPPWRWRLPCFMPAESSAETDIRCPAGCTAWASAWSTPFRRI